MTSVNEISPLIIAVPLGYLCHLMTCRNDDGNNSVGFVEISDIFSTRDDFSKHDNLTEVELVYIVSSTAGG